MKNPVPPSIQYFAVAMKKRRLALGMTQQNVADKSGISLATVNQIEGIKRGEPDWSSIEKISRALHDSVDNLIWEGKLLSVNEVEDARQALGKRIAGIRERREWTKHMLALKVGMAPSHLGNIEAGRTSPTFDKIFQIAKVLGVPLSELMNLEEKK
jgi:transcriptional regulator with XRE-family HTH domain